MRIETRTFIRMLLVVNNLVLITVTGVSLDFFFMLDASIMSEMQYTAAAAAVTGLVTGYAAIYRFMYKEYMDNIVKLSGVQQEAEYEMEGTLKKKG